MSVKKLLLLAIGLVVIIVLGVVFWPNADTWTTIKQGYELPIGWIHPIDAPEPPPFSEECCNDLVGCVSNGPYKGSPFRYSEPHYNSCGVPNGQATNNLAKVLDGLAYLLVLLVVAGGRMVIKRRRAHGKA